MAETKKSRFVVRTYTCTCTSKYSYFPSVNVARILSKSKPAKNMYMSPLKLVKGQLEGPN